MTAQQENNTLEKRIAIYVRSDMAQQAQAPVSLSATALIDSNLDISLPGFIGALDQYIEANQDKIGNARVEVFSRDPLYYTQIDLVGAAGRHIVFNIYQGQILGNIMEYDAQGALVEHEASKYKVREMLCDQYKLTDAVPVHYKEIAISVNTKKIPHYVDLTWRIGGNCDLRDYLTNNLRINACKAEAIVISFDATPIIQPGTTGLNLFRYGVAHPQRIGLLSGPDRNYLPDSKLPRAADLLSQCVDGRLLSYKVIIAREGEPLIVFRNFDDPNELGRSERVDVELSNEMLTPEFLSLLESDDCMDMSPQITGLFQIIADQYGSIQHRLNAEVEPVHTIPGCTAIVNGEVQQMNTNPEYVST